MNKCARCGHAYEGPTCPACKEADEAAARVAREANEAAAKAAREADEKAQAEFKANQGLVWKTALTFFMPFIGGYFLIKEHVKPGFRVFAIIWCSLLALTMGYSVSGEVGVKIIGSLMCLAPIGVYLYKTRDRLFGQSSLSSIISVIAFCILLVVTLIGDVIGPQEESSTGSGTSANISVSASASVSTSVSNSSSSSTSSTAASR
jgi:hypothetical protein